MDITAEQRRKCRDSSEGLVMDEVGDLLFVLSSTDRMKILLVVGKEDRRLSELAGTIDATVQETSKHVKRLVDASLIERRPSGAYGITSFGRITLELIPSFDFLFKNRQYFLTHDLSFLPKELVRRIGELSDHVFVEHVSNVLAECQHLVLMAKEYFWWLIDYPLPWVKDENFDESIGVRGVVPESISPGGYKQTRALLGASAVVRFSPSVKVGLVVNENMAGVCFPDNEGRVDFSRGFLGYNPAFQAWCHDLFDYFWSKSTTTWPVGLEAGLSKLSASGPTSLNPSARKQIAVDR
jgi:predicted transcriptional regulator